MWITTIAALDFFIHIAIMIKAQAEDIAST